MNKKQSVKMLMDLGYPKAMAEKLSANIPDDAAETPQAEIDEALTSCVTHQVDLYMNGSEYKEEIKKATDKKMAEINQKYYKKIMALSGLTPDEIKDKKSDEILDLAWQKASKSSTKGVDELQAELQKRDDELRELKEVKIPEIEGRIEKDRFTLKADNGLMKEIAGLEFQKGIVPDDLVLIAKARAEKEKYKMGFDEKGNFTFLNEDDSKIFTEDKKGYRSPKDVLSTFLDPYIKKSNADDDEDDDKKKKKIIINPDGKNEDRRGSAIQGASKKAEAHLNNLNSAE